MTEEKKEGDIDDHGAESTADVKSTEKVEVHEDDLEIVEDDAKCGSCGKGEKTDEEQEEEDKKKKKPLMSKKKSHLNQPDSDWIRCDHCDVWFHMMCGMEQWEWQIYDKWFCNGCAQIAGPNKFYEKHAPHRHRWYDVNEREKPIEVGSETWIENFKTWEYKFPAATDHEVCVVEDGHEFRSKFDELGGPYKWSKVFLVKNPEGLDMKMPDSSFDLEDVVRIMTPSFGVDTIDVFRQHTYSMKLSTFLQKFRDKSPRFLLYNFLSLEFSENETMKHIATPPKFVQDISIVNQLWPDPSSEAHDELLSNGHALSEYNRPRVEQYFLAGMAHSYTDFHIDFGGSSVYYHIFKGQKVFYIAEPTNENLLTFAAHAKSQSTTEWFGDKIQGKVKRVVVNEGETLLMPAGWIHAVYTPKDSLVFGGNFLHLGNLKMQQCIYRLENSVRAAINSDAKFYFPCFEYIHWMYMKNILIPKMEEAVEEGSDMRDVDPDMWKAAQYIAKKLDEWFKRDDSEKGGETEKEDRDISLNQKRKVLRSIQKLSVDHFTPSKTTKRKSTDAIDSAKKYSKTPKKSSTDEASKMQEEASRHDIPHTSAKILMEPTEDEKNARKMFIRANSSSGGAGNSNQVVSDSYGHLETQDDEIIVLPTPKVPKEHMVTKEKK